MRGQGRKSQAACGLRERGWLGGIPLRCSMITEFASTGFEKLKQQVEKDCRFR
jgi:hypothetical protein